jgi:hypothetical protein
MSKFVNRSITIRVPPGEITTDIILDRFYGPGVINLFAVDVNGATVNAHNVQTHRLHRVAIQNCACQINVQGFAATANNTDGFLVNQSSGLVQVIFCNATEGVNTTTANIGIRSRLSAHVIASMSISNKFVAADSVGGRLEMGGSRGSENATVFRATYRGQIQIEGGTLSGTNRYWQSHGGLIVDHNGIPESLIVKGV